MHQKNLIVGLHQSIRAALKTGNHAEATRITERLKEHAPRAIETRGFELEILLGRGRLEEAEKLSTELVRLFPNSGKILYLAGKSAYLRRDYGKAEVLFKESHNTAPHYISRLWLAKTYTNSGKLEKAEPIFEDLSKDHPSCLKDLAWLYERKKEYTRAASKLDEYIAFFPNDKHAKEQKTKLLAYQVDAEELIEQVEALEELTEDVPELLAAQYLESLIKSGKVVKAREFVQKNKPRYQQRALTSMAWVCYHTQVHDVAFDLFTDLLDNNLSNPKFLVALEKSASATGRIQELIEAYESRAENSRNLYGRVKKIKKLSDQY